MKKNLFVAMLLASTIFTISGCEGCNSKKEAAQKKTATAIKTLVKKAAPSTTGKLPDAPDELIKAILKDLDNQDPRILWKALPAGYQKDVNSIVTDFAKKMDKDLWNKGFVILTKLTDVAKEKKKFIFNSQMLSQIVKQQKLAKEKKQIDDAWDGVVAILNFVATCQISKLENLNNFDGGKFVESMIKDAKSIDPKQIDRFKKMMMKYAADDDDKNDSKEYSLTDVKVEKIKADDKNATVKVTSPDGESEELKLVKVEGRWVPYEMSKEWKEMITDAKKSISGFSGLEMKKQKPKILAMLAAAESGLDQLKNAKTQKEFDMIFMSLMQSFQ